MALIATESVSIALLWLLLPPAVGHDLTFNLAFLPTATMGDPSCHASSTDSLANELDILVSLSRYMNVHCLGVGTKLEVKRPCCAG